MGFCVTLWEALHGARPSGSDSATIRCAEVASRVNAALIRWLAADPEKRWRSVNELLDALADPAEPAISRKAIVD